MDDMCKKCICYGNIYYSDFLKLLLFSLSVHALLMTQFKIFYKPNLIISAFLGKQILDFSRENSEVYVLLL